MLLFGKSGVGKSTLSFACARSGWTYISDDASAVVWGRGRTVTGEPHHFRFRAEAPEIFPELRGLTVGYQLDRKPTIEVYTANLPIRAAQECRVEWIVFVERGPQVERGACPFPGKPLANACCAICQASIPHWRRRAWAWSKGFWKHRRSSYGTADSRRQCRCWRLWFVRERSHEFAIRYDS